MAPVTNMSASQGTEGIVSLLSLWSFKKAINEGILIQMGSDASEWVWKNGGETIMYESARSDINWVPFTHI